MKKLFFAIMTMTFITVSTASSLVSDKEGYGNSKEGYGDQGSALNDHATIQYAHLVEKFHKHKDEMKETLKIVIENLVRAQQEGKFPTIDEPLELKKKILTDLLANAWFKTVFESYERFWDANMDRKVYELLEEIVPLLKEEGSPSFQESPQVKAEIFLGDREAIEKGMDIYAKIILALNQMTASQRSKVSVNPASKEAVELVRSNSDKINTLSDRAITKALEGLKTIGLH